MLNYTEVTCYPGAGPSLNMDIGGIGVRISFYLQALFLGCLSTRSSSLDEIRGALYTLVATNLAMIIAALILGLKPSPEISFQDALVALYLLATSWTTTVFSLSSCIRFKEGIKSLQMLSVIQSYLFFAFVSILLITTKTFGSSPECNVNAVLVIYAPFPVIEAGRIVGGIITLVVVLAYTYMVLKDYFAKIQERVKPEIGVLRDLTGESNLVVEIPDITEPNPQRPTNPQRSSSTPENINVSHPVEQKYHNLNIDGRVILLLVFIVITWTLVVLNTELLIVRNKFKQSSDASWTFGQVLPMFLVVLPLVDTINAFKKHGFRRVDPEPSIKAAV